MSNIRIIYVTTVDLTVRFLLLAQLRHLQQAGYQVSAVCAPGPWTEEIRAAGIGVHPVDLRRQIAPLADLAALVALVRYFREVHPHLVQTHTPKANLLAGWRRLAGVPVIVAPSTASTSRHDRPTAPVLGVALPVGGRWSDAVFLINEEDMDTASPRGICRPGGRHLAGGGGGLTATPWTRRGHCPRRLGMPADAPVVGMVGRLT